MGLPLAADDGLFAVCSVYVCVCALCVCGGMCVCVCLSKVFIKRKSAQLGACYYAKGFRAQSVYALGVGVVERGGRGGHLVAHLVLLSAVTGLCISLFGSASAAAAAWQRQCCIILLNSRCGFAISKSSSSSSSAKGA